MISSVSACLSVLTAACTFQTYSFTYLSTCLSSRYTQNHGSTDLLILALVYHNLFCSYFYPCISTSLLIYSSSIHLFIDFSPRFSFITSLFDNAVRLLSNIRLMSIALSDRSPGKEAVCYPIYLVYPSIYLHFKDGGYLILYILHLSIIT